MANWSGNSFSFRQISLAKVYVSGQKVIKDMGFHAVCRWSPHCCYPSVGVLTAKKTTLPAFEAESCTLERHSGFGSRPIEQSMGGRIPTPGPSGITRNADGIHFSSCLSRECRDDHKMAGRPIYGPIPKVVDSHMVQKMRKKSEACSYVAENRISPSLLRSEQLNRHLGYQNHPRDRTNTSLLCRRGDSRVCHQV